MFNGNIPTSWFLPHELEQISSNPDQSFVFSLNPITRRYPLKTWDSYAACSTHAPFQLTRLNRKLQVLSASYSNQLSPLNPALSYTFRRYRQHKQQQEQGKAAASRHHSCRVKPRPKPLSPFRLLGQVDDDDNLQQQHHQQQYVQCKRCRTAFNPSDKQQQQQQQGRLPSSHNHHKQDQQQLRQEGVVAKAATYKQQQQEQGEHKDQQQQQEQEAQRQQQHHQQQQTGKEAAAGSNRAPLWGPSAPGGGGPGAHFYLNPTKQELSEAQHAEEEGPGEQEDSSVHGVDAVGSRVYPFSKLESEGVQLLRFGPWGEAAEEPGRREGALNRSSNGSSSSSCDSGSSSVEGGSSSHISSGSSSSGHANGPEAENAQVADANITSSSNDRGSGSSSSSSAKEWERGGLWSMSSDHIESNHSSSNSSSSSSTSDEWSGPGPYMLGGVTFVVSTDPLTGPGVGSGSIGSSWLSGSGTSSSSSAFKGPAAADGRFCSCCGEKLHGRRPRGFARSRRGGSGQGSRGFVGPSGFTGFSEAGEEMAKVVEGITNWWLGAQDRDGMGRGDWEEEGDSDMDEGYEEGSMWRGVEPRVGAAVVGSGQVQPEFGLHSDGRGVVYGFWSKCWLG